MPTYGYQCIECKHEFSVFQAMKDDPISTCPECTAPVKRLLYPVGVVFKGSGWYVNDSRKPEKTEESASSKSSEGTTGSDSKSPDSKSPDGKASDSSGSSTDKPAATPASPTK